MKKGKMLMVALAFVVLTAGTAQASTYVEGYIGGNLGANSPDSARLSSTFAIPITSNYPGHIDPAFMAGIKIGVWFEEGGFLGFKYPEWMKYLGMYSDFSFHRLDFPRRNGGTIGVSVGQMGVVNLPYQVYSEGGGVGRSLAFMFAFRYGFFPDKEVPFGRLQPYVAVGPILFFSWQQPTVRIPGTGVTSDFALKFESESSTDVGVAVETGLRWMCLKNVSIEVAFKYRHVQPTYKYKLAGGAFTLKFDPTYNLFSVIMGAAYHF